MQLFGKAWWTGIATGTILTTMIIAPRLASVVLLFILLVAGADHLFRRGVDRQPVKFGLPFLTITAFAAWGLVSSNWSAAPTHSLLKPFFMLLITLAAWLALRTVSSVRRPYAHYFGEGAITGIIVSYILVSIEILTDQFVSRTVMSAIPISHENLSKHVSVDADGIVTKVTHANINRRCAILTWLLWPAIMLALHDPSRIRRAIALGVVAGGTAIILFAGAHQSSQIAILGGLFAYVVAWASLKFARTAVIACWSICTLLAVPLALLLYETNLQNADWLFTSARHRVIIWQTTASETLKTPIFGIGADATREAMDAAEASQVAEQKQKRETAPEASADKKKVAKKKKSRLLSGYANHAHNAFLQVWYELGAIGAALFLAFGIFVMRAIGRLDTAIQPSAIALFVTTTLMISFSYSIWQTWFIAALAYAVIIFAVAVRKRADQLAHPGADDVPEPTGRA